MLRWRTGVSRWAGGGIGEWPKRGRRVWGYHAGPVARDASGALATTCLVIVLVVGLVSCAQPGPTGWTIIASPSLSVTENSLLNAVAAVATNDVWVVGMRTVNTAPQTLTEHWNGTQWHIIPSPNVPGVNNALDGGAAVAAHDVWAVGFSNPGRTLTEHWNGATWTIIPSPNEGSASSFNILHGVAAVATNNVWAVGEYSTSTGAPLTLIEHWNGVSWSIVPSPNFRSVNSSNHLLGVTAVAANDIWAVGYYQATPSSLAQTLTEHWNGVIWSIVSSPNAQPGVVNNELVSVTAVAANDVWAVGFYKKPPPLSAPSETLIEHWNGAVWMIVPSPNVSPGVEDNGLLGVTTVAAHDVWAVGSSGSGAPHPPQTLTEHWNGVTWSIVSSPNAHGVGASNVLAGVAAIATSDVWAVGNYADLTTNIQQPLTERYS